MTVQIIAHPGGETVRGSALSDDFAATRVQQGWLTSTQECAILDPTEHFPATGGTNVVIKANDGAVYSNEAAEEMSTSRWSQKYFPKLFSSRVSRPVSLCCLRCYF